MPPESVLRPCAPPPRYVIPPYFKTGGLCAGCTYRYGCHICPRFELSDISPVFPEPGAPPYFVGKELCFIDLGTVLPAQIMKPEGLRVPRRQGPAISAVRTPISRNPPPYVRHTSIFENRRFMRRTYAPGNRAGSKGRTMKPRGPGNLRTGLGSRTWAHGYLREA